MKLSSVVNRVFFILFSCSACFFTGNAVAKQDEIVLAIHPFLSHEEITKKFSPFARYLESRIGHKVTIRVGSTYQEHIDYIGQDHVDIAYLGPASYVTMTEKFGMKPLLARLEVKGNPFFRGNIVVRKDSQIHSLSDLKGKQIAFGDPNSTMSYIVPHHMLHEAGIFEDKKTKHQFLYSHTNVALSVLSGDFDAGAIKPAVFEKFEKDGLKVLVKTPSISEHLFVTRSNMDKKLVNTLRDALLTMRENEEGLEALHSIKSSITGLTAVTNEDYANLREIIRDSGHFHQ